ncbi:hypothetical protein [Stenotrophomonas maltophilia]|uniref:Uncharacterized protein n=1 Tax=Stenotrophomonas maltophilia TaxID=40324 RepID=A0A2W6HXK2_STEMA|nr:hypothetical protein [Stenotrophomonas maltophilia]PZS88131.1 hypothetical protein A7X83_15540 [Stenotrophomonas maltophilia]
MANIKYADPSYTDTNATDDDRVMLRTGAGGDARAPLVQPKGYIDGLKLVYVSATQIQVTNGAAYVPGPKRIAELAAAVTLTPSLAASTWYHLYLTVTGATVGVESVTTAPAAPYTGTARAKTGDTSRRYIGSFRTNASAQIIQFLHQGDHIDYLRISGVTELRVLANGQSVSDAPVNCANVVPVTSRLALLRFVNTDTTLDCLTGLSDIGTGGIHYQLRMSSAVYAIHPLNSSQVMTYFWSVSAPTGGLFIDVAGYYYDR